MAAESSCPNDRRHLRTNRILFFTRMRHVLNLLLGDRLLNISDFLRQMSVDQVQNFIEHGLDLSLLVSQKQRLGIKQEIIDDVLNGADVDCDVLLGLLELFKGLDGELVKFD